MKRTRATAARGISLIELMMVIWVAGIVTGLVAVTLSGFLRLDRVARDDAALAGTLPALELQLRHDIHAATNAQIDEQTLELEIGQQQVVWKPSGNGLCREVYHGFLEAQERWSFSSPHELVWTTEEHEGRNWLSLELNANTPNDQRYPPPQRSVHIVGELGRHRRLSQEDAR